MRSIALSTALLALGCADGSSTDPGAPPRDSGPDVADVASDAIFPVEDAAADVDAPAPKSCHDAPVTAWSAPTKLAAVQGVVKGAAVHDPYVLPDGLTLLFASTDASGKSRLHAVQRPSRSVPFTGGAPIAGFEGAEWSGIDIVQPAAHRLEEIVFSAPPNNGDLWVGTRSAPTGAVSPKRYAEAFVNGTDIEGGATFTADGERMIFSRSPLSGTYGLYEATRLSTSPGAPWASVTALSSLNNPAYSVACPALSADGLTLYFANNSEDPKEARTTVFVSQRTTRTTPFGTPTAIASLTAPGKFNCPRSVTADGCELYLTTDLDGTFTAHVATRLPK